MLVLCEREILLAECSEDEANRVNVYGSLKSFSFVSMEDRPMHIHETQH